MVENIMEQVEALTDSEFERLKAWVVVEETQRRAVAPALEKAITDLWEKEPVFKPDIGQDDQWPVWSKPVSLLRAYPDGAQVTHQGRKWINAVGGLNMSEPGVSGAWREHTGLEQGPVATDLLPAEGQDPSGEDPAEDEEPTTATTDEESAPQADAVEWTPKTTYTPGERVSYGGVTYTVVKEHVSGMTSTPPHTPELYTPED